MEKFIEDLQSNHLPHLYEEMNKIKLEENVDARETTNSYID